MFNTYIIYLFYVFVKNRKRLHPTGKPVGFRLRCAKVYFITAIEYGNNLADICREKFKDYNGFEVITSKFEDVELETVGLPPFETVTLDGSNSSFIGVTL